MSKQAPTPDTPAAGEAAQTAEEPANVAVFVKQNRTVIRKHLCAYGRCDFPLTMSEAKALEAMDLVEIVGLF